MRHLVVGLVVGLVGVAAGLRPGCVSRAWRRRRRRPNPSALLPLAYLGVMGAPIYGRGLVPGTGDLLDFATLAPRSSPNEFLAAPPDAAPAFDDAAKRAAAPTFPVAADELRSAFERALRSRMLPGLGDVYARPTKSAGRRFVYVERTPLFRFPDVLNVEFVPLSETTSTVVLHSGSVFGQSDLGKNEARVRELLDALRDLPPAMKRASVPV